MLAGVAGGVAETFDLDPSIVRVVWALLVILTGGLAFVVYVVMAIVVPEDHDELPAPTSAMQPSAAGPPAAEEQAATSPAGPAPLMLVAPATRSERRAARRAAHGARRDGRDTTGAAAVLGVVLIVIGALFLIRQVLPWFDFDLWWPITLVGLGVLLIVASARPTWPPR
jgi:phage shock protein C